MDERGPNLNRVPSEILEREIDEIQRDLKGVDGEYTDEETGQVQRVLEENGLISTPERARDVLFVTELIEKGILDKQDFEEELKKRGE